MSLDIKCNWDECEDTNIEMQVVIKNQLSIPFVEDGSELEVTEMEDALSVDEVLFYCHGCADYVDLSKEDFDKVIEWGDQVMAGANRLWHRQIKPWLESNYQPED